MYSDFCFLLKHSCTNMWLCWEYTEKRKKAPKHFFLGMGIFVLGMARLQLPQTPKPAAPFLFQLCSSYCFGITPGHVWYLLSGASLCRIPVPGQGLLSLCVGWGSVKAQSHKVWGVWDGHRALGRAAHGSWNPRDSWSLEETSLLLPRSPGGRQRLEKRFPQSLINNQNLPGLGNEVPSLHILFSSFLLACLLICFKKPNGLSDQKNKLVNSKFSNVRKWNSWSLRISLILRQ